MNSSQDFLKIWLSIGMTMDPIYEIAQVSLWRDCESGFPMV